MRRRALLTAISGLTAVSLAGCVSTSKAKYERTVRDWQDVENRSFVVNPEAGQTIRIELQETQSNGASFEIYKPDMWDGTRLLQTPFMSPNRGNLEPVEYEVDEGGKYTVIVHPCCAPGGGISFAWVRIYVE